MTYLEELFSLRGRAAVVTGGSGGIGFAIAEALASAGAAVVLVGRDRGRLEQATQDLTGQGLVARSVSVDLAQRSEVDLLVTRLEEWGVEPDILLNAAGVNIRPPLDRLLEADVSQTMAVNLMAPFLLGQHWGPQMAARGWGRIINIGSQQASRAFGNSGVYGVSKAGVTGLSRSQAEAWSPYGVCCNTVAPGFVETRMTADAVAEPGRSQALAARTLVGRNGLPSDFCGVAVFLASAASAYVTGQLIHVDGGFSVS